MGLPPLDPPATSHRQRAKVPAGGYRTSSSEPNWEREELSPSKNRRRIRMANTISPQKRLVICSHLGGGGNSKSMAESAPANQYELRDFGVFILPKRGRRNPTPLRMRHPRRAFRLRRPFFPQFLWASKEIGQGSLKNGTSS
jgi:hypothetical protein